MAYDNEPYKLEPSSTQTIFEGNQKANENFAEINNDITILDSVGTAATADKQTSPTDTTAGALMAIGAGGILDAGMLITDNELNGNPATGFYSIINLSTTPEPAGVLNVIRRSDAATRGAQVFYPTASGATEPISYIRSQIGTSEYTPWRSNYHTGNILGTFSGSSFGSNDPIFQRGSNSNGEYVKFADGTLICARKQLIDVTTTESQLFNFPSTFASGRKEALSFSGVTAINTALRFSNIADFHTNGTAWNIQLETAGTVGATSLNDTFNLLAIGRWFE